MTEAEVGVMLLLAGAMSWGMWVASRAGKGQETGSSLEPPEAVQALWPLAFHPVKPIWTSALQNYKKISLCCFKATKFVVTCYSNIKKCIQGANYNAYKVQNVPQMSKVGCM